MNTPPVSDIRVHDTHRLIPAAHSEDAPAPLSRLADSAAALRDLADLAGATAGAAGAAAGAAAGIGADELIFGAPYARVINGAFTHPHPQGGRFNGPDRGAWYAGFELETAQAEIIRRKVTELAEINWWRASAVYDDYITGFSGPYYDLRAAPAWRGCMNPESYMESQALAETLMDADAPGVVYSSARRAGGTCIACFRPALVLAGGVRRGARHRFTWAGSPKPRLTAETP